MKKSTLEGSRFGVEVSGLDLSNVSDSGMEEIRKLLLEEKLVVFRGQNLSEADQIAFTSFFGKPDMAWDNRNRSQDSPEVQIISNTYKGGGYHYDRRRLMSTVRYWHADTSFLQDFTRYTFLSIKVVPEKFGETHFLHTGLAYLALEQEIKLSLKDAMVVHSFDFLFGELLRQRNDEREEDVPDVLHPLFMDDENGKTFIYMSELSMKQLQGFDQDLGNKLLTQICEHCKLSEFRYDHKWRQGDFLVWDNLGIAHRGGFADPEHPRVLHRTTVTRSGVAQPLT